MNIKGIIKLFISKSILKKRADHLLDKQREVFYKGCKELLELTDDTLQNADMKLKYEVHFGDWENPENIEYRFEYKNTFIGFNFYKVPVIWQLRVPHLLSQE